MFAMVVVERKGQKDVLQVVYLGQFVKILPGVCLGSERDSGMRQSVWARASAGVGPAVCLLD